MDLDFNFTWKLNQLMEMEGIDHPQRLAELIRSRYPESEGEIGESTIRAILGATLDRITQAGLVALCQFFRLKSLAQLVDFNDAPATPLDFWHQDTKLKVTFKLQSFLDEKDIPQKQLIEESYLAGTTINRFCRGTSEKISFGTLIVIGESLRRMTRDQDNPQGFPISITEILDIEAVKPGTVAHPAIERQRRRREEKERQRREAKLNLSIHTARSSATKPQSQPKNPDNNQTSLSTGTVDRNQKLPEKFDF